MSTPINPITQKDTSYYRDLIYALCREYNLDFAYDPEIEQRVDLRMESMETVTLEKPFKIKAVTGILPSFNHPEYKVSEFPIMSSFKADFIELCISIEKTTQAKRFKYKDMPLGFQRAANIGIIRKRLKLLKKIILELDDNKEENISLIRRLDSIKE